MDAIAGWRLDDAAFEALARDLFVYQAEHNAAYAAYARALGYDATHTPESWREIPAVPSLAFKETTLTTFDPADAALVFETSGTTRSQSGRHYMETTRLYDAALLAGFDRFVLDDRALLRYLLLVPERAASSLGYMLRRVAAERGDGREGWYLQEDGLDADRLIDDLGHAYDEGVPVCIAGTAFAFVALLDVLAARNLAPRTRPGSRIMETGGFKGRSREIKRDDLYRELAQRFGIGEELIAAEYGMTELTSQYYDAPSSRTSKERVKVGPPWLRSLIVGPDGREVGPGHIGALQHVDLANRGSVIAVATEDLALRLEGEGFVLLGRDAEARLRGCSLDAEDLLARSR